MHVASQYASWRQTTTPKVTPPLKQSFYTLKLMCVFEYLGN